MVFDPFENGNLHCPIKSRHKKIYLLVNWIFKSWHIKTFRSQKIYQDRQIWRKIPIFVDLNRNIMQIIGFQEWFCASWQTSESRWVPCPQKCPSGAVPLYNIACGNLPECHTLSHSRVGSRCRTPYTSPAHPWPAGDSCTCPFRNPHTVPPWSSRWGPRWRGCQWVYRLRRYVSVFHGDSPYADDYLFYSPCKGIRGMLAQPAEAKRFRVHPVKASGDELRLLLPHRRKEFHPEAIKTTPVR